MATSYAGTRLRALRSERGMSQVALADALGISPSYLNQIEHGNRPLTPRVLVRVTEAFGIDGAFFDVADDSRLVAELREVLMDEDVDAAADAGDISAVVAAHPEIAQAMVNLHRRYRRTTDQLAAVTDDRSDASMRGAITAPHEEVRDYFYQRQNYLHSLDTAAEELTSRMRMHAGDIPAGIVDALETTHGVRIVSRVDLGEDLLHRFDPATRVLEISAHLSRGQRVFRLASELAYLECGPLLDELVEEGSFTSEEAHTLAYQGLANYYAAAAVLPYSHFHGAAEEFRYDIERLSAFYAVSYETICHRLSTLQRPHLRGVPFSFVRVDRAGNMSKRQSATGFHFSNSGGTCPLWNVYESFGSPNKILTQIAQMPDGREYLWVARTVERRARRYGQPGKTFAIGLGCEIRHASRMIYSDGLELGPRARTTPIGIGCRVCERENCPQRAFPALGARLDIETHRSTTSPYLVR